MDNVDPLLSNRTDENHVGFQSAAAAVHSTGALSRQGDKISTDPPANPDSYLNQNSLTVVWGIIGLFGVLISLLIQPASQAYTAYLTTVSQYDHDRVYPLSQAIKWTPVVVLVGVFFLSIPSIVYCVRKHAFYALSLIGGTLLAQLLFTVGVNILAPDVPQTIPNVAHPDLCSTKLPYSIEAERETTVRFRNDSTHRVEIIWLGYAGEHVSYGVLQPGRFLFLPTWVTHPFVMTDLDDGNRCLAVVIPTDQVGTATTHLK